ncbi:MAG: hypothetical protein M3305_00185 [Actinomycetota bacterium]|nr:hypothetical protein [Actinomycetota bacterium]
MGAKDEEIYEIEVKGVLDGRWSEWFDGMTLRSDDSSGQTTSSGSVADQAALHGLLNKVRDLGLPLLAVRRLNPAALPSDRRAVR